MTSKELIVLYYNLGDPVAFFVHNKINIYLKSVHNKILCLLCFFPAGINC